MRACLALAALLVITASASAQPLSGTYTINPAWPAGGFNFVGLNAAVAALNANGVAGPVTFEVFDDAGPYAETISYTTAASYLSLGNNDAALLLGQWAGVTPTNRVVFRNAPNEAPVINATGRAVAVYWNGADDTTLEGFEIRGALFDAICMYTPSGADAIRNRIDRCHIHSIGRVGVLTYGNTGAVNDNVIANSLFHDCMTSTNGGGFSGFIRDGYISGRRDNNTQILHNTFICNTMAQSNGWILGNYPSGTQYTAFTRVEGNIFVKLAANGTIFNFQTSGAAVAPTLPVTSDRNCFWNVNTSNIVAIGPLGAPATTYASLSTWQTGTSRDLASISADPLLVASPSSPVLALASPCISAAGTTVGVATDYDREVRIGGFDIGADQSISSSQPRVLEVGTGCPGGGGITPYLSTTQNPFIGNLGFTVDVSASAPNTVGFAFPALGLAVPQFPVAPSCFVYLDPVSLTGFFGSGFGPFAFAVGGAGNGSLPLPIPLQANLSGAEVGLQVAISDLGSPTGFSLTNALLLRIN